MTRKAPSCPRFVLIAAMLALSLFVARAEGAPPAHGDVEGYVLSIEGDDVIIDIGGARGATVGDVFELWRPIELTHPVTKQRIKDRYRIGRLKIVQVRDRMAVATAEDAKVAPEVGDFVLWRREVVEPSVETSAHAANGSHPASATPSAVVGGSAPPPGAALARTPPPAVVGGSAPPPGAALARTPPPAGAPAAAASDEEAQRVAALFDSLHEASPDDRIAAYIAYSRKNPRSPFARVLHDDAVQFYRILRKYESAGSEEAPQSGSSSAPSTAPAAPAPVDFDAPAYAVSGRDLELGLHAPPEVVGAVLHVRRHDAVSYTSAPMVKAGTGYFRATIPASSMVPPKTEYFVEGIDTAGRAHPIVGSDDQPLSIDVERRPTAEPPTLQKRTTASIQTDWADFNRLRNDRLDRTWQTEGLLGMRFGDIGIRAVRTGFGIYRGVSGSLEELDNLSIKYPLEREVGLTYGYLEGEFGILHSASLIARLVGGLTEAGTTTGALAMVRIGNDLETNLELGLEVLGGVGLRSITQLELHPTPRFPVLVRSEVTNQPAGVSDPNFRGPVELHGDIGLRAIVQPGYEVWPGLVLALRLSYQGRTIYHAGPGFGGAVSYSW